MRRALRPFSRRGLPSGDEGLRHRPQKATRGVAAAGQQVPCVVVAHRNNAVRHIVPLLFALPRSPWDLSAPGACFDWIAHCFMFLLFCCSSQLSSLTTRNSDEEHYLPRVAFRMYLFDAWRYCGAKCSTGHAYARPFRSFVSVHVLSYPVCTCPFSARFLFALHCVRPST